MWTRRQVIASGAAALATGPLQAQLSADTPIEQTRVLCGFAPGGTMDAVSRLVAEKLRGSFAKVALVENRPGAAGRVVVAELKKGAPDGSVILVSPTTVFALYPHVFKKVNYSADDVVPVCSVVSLDIALGVGPLVPPTIKTLREFLAWSKAESARASFASAGAGSPTHLLGALVGKEAGVELNHVAYRGAALAMQDLLGGQIAAASLPLGDFLPHLKSERVRLLATSNSQRSRFTPMVPTYKEQGFPSLVSTQSYVVFVPKGTPKAVLDRLAATIKSGFTAPDVMTTLGHLGLEVSVNTAAEALQALGAEGSTWPGIVQRVGYVAED